MAHSSPRLPEAFDSGAFGGAFLCIVVVVESLLLQLRVVDFIVGRYILVMFNPVVLLAFFVELFCVTVRVSVVVVVLVDSLVFGVADIRVSVVVRFRWWFVFGRLDVGVGVHVSPGTVKWKRIRLKLSVFN